MIKRVRDLLGRSSKPEAEADPAPVPATPPEPGWTAREEYFEQLDKAFSDFDGTMASAKNAETAREGAADVQFGAMSKGRLAPEVADAFEALLAAEESGEEFIPAAVHLPDYVIERIAARVAHKLNDGALKDTVRDIVTEVAERLVREEITRIRAKVESDRS
jgi:hypothetical protein